jgi:gamma-glutamylcyclotransferase (GGCT)/AIG2-like uncharacterized protein YtfP
MEVVYVYGSLRRGQTNHDEFLGSSRFLGAGKLAGFRLCACSASYPTGIKSGDEDDAIWVEAYEIDGALITHPTIFHR